MCVDELLFESLDVFKTNGGSFLPFRISAISSPVNYIQKQ
jgi:hypothetical protein